MLTSSGAATLDREFSLRAQIRAGRLPAVQILRALAALSIVLGHALYEAQTFDRAGRYFLVLDADLWKMGVDLFFVLSGFIMMWTFGHRFGDPYAGREFLRRRLERIVPPYWIFTGLMVAATLLFANRLGTAAFTPEHALLSLLFIPHLAPNGGIHPILSLGWTLIYEMFFYLSFALALSLERRAGLAALTGLFVLVHGIAVYTDMLPEALRLFWGDGVMFEFLLGVGFFLVLSNGRLAATRLVLVLLFCLTASGAAYLSGMWGESRLYHFGLPALAVFALFYWLLPEVEARFWLFLVLVGEASYTLYLSHPFVLEIVEGAIALVPLPDAGHISLYVAASIISATAFSLLFYSMLERQLTQWLASRADRWAPKRPTGEANPPAAGSLSSSVRNPRGWRWPPGRWHRQGVRT